MDNKKHLYATPETEVWVLRTETGLLQGQGSITGTQATRNDYGEAQKYTW